VATPARAAMVVDIAPRGSFPSGLTAPRRFFPNPEV